MRITGLFLLLLTISIPNAYADKVYVAVASNFTHTAKQIAKDFEEQTGHKVSLAFGSSGKLAAQIKNGAPFEVFLSADTQKPEKIEDWGLAIPGSRVTYAIGALALWSATPNLVDSEGAILRLGDFQHLAAANPKLAPYGVAAQETLKELGLTTKLRGRIVEGENISQTFQFVASGTAKLGFVAQSQVLENGELTHGSIWKIPNSMHRPILQDALLLKKATNKPAAKQFLKFLGSAASQEHIRLAGYHLPNKMTN